MRRLQQLRHNRQSIYKSITLSPAGTSGCVCVYNCIHGHAFHLPPFFLGIFFFFIQFELHQGLWSSLVLLSVPSALSPRLSLCWRACRCISRRTSAHECMCVSARIAYVCLSAWLLLVSARLVYLSLLPLSGKRLNPRRLVTVLFARRVFWFPPARVTKLLWLALLLGLERNKPEMPMGGEGKWQLTKKRIERDHWTARFFFASCFGGGGDTKIWKCHAMFEQRVSICGGPKFGSILPQMVKC